jgi:hypothetical protein
MMSDGSVLNTCTHTFFSAAIAYQFGMSTYSGNQFPGNQGNHNEFNNMDAKLGGTVGDFLSRGGELDVSHGVTWDMASYGANLQHQEVWDNACN